ncbi:MAG: CDP-diacylglycerol--glycerol-3-phosphate 3-phosphatidyltransferase [Bdellovibrionales bacterium]|nr:CDP-diacylglycerol--glycerol-3-phosphate 3-phosphatidyltransferase [Bdellovibrionales bacterium]
MNWKKKLPMAATSVRFFVAPIIFAVMLSGWKYAAWVATALFILGSFTDWLDGYWARLFHAESNMGKFMDPIADKILVLSVLIILLYFKRIDPVAPAILLSRDIFIGGLRSVAAADNVVISAKPTGKWKTALQMVAIPCLFVDIDFYGISLHSIGLWTIWLSVILSIISGVEYTRGYFKGAKNL